MARRSDPAGHLFWTGTGIYTKATLLPYTDGMGLGAAEKTSETETVAATVGRKPPLASIPSPTAVCFVLLSFYMILLIWSGSPLNGDADDLIKLHELRTFIATGNVFDRTLPGVLQPEAYVSHWPWLVDLPYALVAWPLIPALGFETALSVACFVVPLLLLAPALYCYGRLVTAVGFNDTIVPLFVAVIYAAASLFEFAPHRIDYHNLQIVLFFAALVLALSQHRLAAVANGLVVSLALAISFEFAIFHALVIGVYAFDFVFAASGGAARLRNFGAGLMAGALLLFAAIVPPSAYAVGQCDTYSAPYVLALVLAGAVFVGISVANDRRDGWLIRTLMLCGFAAASVIVVLTLYPQCAGGPYGEMSARLREVTLGDIPQEKSLLQRPDFILSDSLLGMTLLFVGALALAALCLIERRPQRPLVIVALASVLAFVQAIAYFRYLRYLPFFSGIGLVFIAAALLPPSARGILTARHSLGRWPWRAFLLAAPGLGVTAALVLFCIVDKPAPMPPSAFGLTSFCGPASATVLTWPENSIVLSPPLLGAGLVAQFPHPGVVAIPNHHAARGMDRVDRFLDPGTGDPRRALDESHATHVVVCAAPQDLRPALRQRFAFAVSLMEGRPPAWLAQCPAGTGSLLRVYSYRLADGSAAACPSLQLAGG
jgi:hypothetical protein